MHLVHSRSKFDATWLACAFLAGIPGCGAAADSPAGEIGVAQDALSIGAPIIGLANKCIAVSATNDLTPSGNRRVYLRTCNGASTQNWKRLNNSTIQNTGTGLCLNAENGGTGNLTNLIAYQCSSTPLPNEKWIMKQSGTALQAWMIQGVGSGRCVNVPGGNTADKTGLVLYTCQNQSNDQWTVSEPAPIVGNAGKCVDIGTDQRRVVLNTCNGSAQQDWWRNSQGQLVNGSTGQCLNVENGSITTDGAAVIVYPCSATALSNEIWANTAAGTNANTPTFQIHVNGNGKCLNVPNAAQADQRPGGLL